MCVHCDGARLQVLIGKERERIGVFQHAHACTRLHCETSQPLFWMLFIECLSMHFSGARISYDLLLTGTGRGIGGGGGGGGGGFEETFYLFRGHQNITPR